MNEDDDMPDSDVVTSVAMTMLAQVCHNTLFMIEDHKSEDQIMDYFKNGIHKVFEILDAP